MIPNPLSENSEVFLSSMSIKLRFSVPQIPTPQADKHS